MPDVEKQREEDRLLGEQHRKKEEAERALADARSTAETYRKQLAH